MSYKNQFLHLFLAILIGGAALLGCAKKSEWIVLFNGSSTGAWRGFQRQDFPSGGWVIENGSLKTVVGGDQCDIITKEKFKNFELEAEWRVAPGGNSGIFYRVTEEYPAVWQSAPEMQVLDDSLHRDGLDPRTSAGALYGLIAPTNKALMPVGEYNKAKVIVQGNHVEHWLNNVKILEYELGSEELQSLIAESKFKEFAGFARASEGHIALQHHGEEVWYRNIRIRPID
ncbi:MAG: DUF1080 domain-containing protein [candidate division KSB1 bacterium]|nr:DUF1080 domain-containing protein [candidate division KSB1 bacterium]MDZ7336229.1 DUF1080 domain-containing protein [candidate division KSB1 bacterium]MDZ7357628.1 DUF1080 domain-containing protein [candidate division KSB1 bacterium]MDZ7401559.1 DUF1080 domain-containing protein [candidate division KSB1 bacterium]